jgi:hypothetical protein
MFDDRHDDEKALSSEELLSLTLDPTDLAVLVSTGQNPEEYIAMDLGPLQVQQGQDASGRTFLQILVELPKGTFTSRPRLHLPSGQANNALDGVLAIPPRVRIVVRRDRMTSEARDALRTHLSQRWAPG